MTDHTPEGGIVPALDRRKSSYSGEGNDCLGPAAAPDGSARLREGDAPDALLRITRAGLADPLRAAEAGRVRPHRRLNRWLRPPA